MVESLPKLPGYLFHDPSELNRRHFKTDHFGFRHGLPVSLYKDTRDSNSIGFLQTPATPGYHPFHTYGRCKNAINPPTKPFKVDYDKKVLFFKASMKQPMQSLSLEHYCIRQFQIYYFLEDDTIKITEPKQINSGFTQGQFLSRHKVTKGQSGECYNWKDFDIGQDCSFYGHVMHIVDCDTFTREYYISQGIRLNYTEDLPPDPFTQTSLARQNLTHSTPIVDDKLRRFLDYSGAVLKFNCLEDDKETENEAMNEYILYYNLEDDTISGRIVRTRNDGRDPFTFIFRHCKAPKSQPHEYPSIILERNDQDIDEYYQPKDFLVGNTVFILGRRYLIIDCDPFTRKYFKAALDIDQKPKLELPESRCRQAKKIPITVPPHISKLGAIEDTIEQFKLINPAQPQKDEIKLLMNAQKNLRYSAVLVSSHPEDHIRNFIIFYSLADNKIKIQESVIKNSGIKGGKFLNAQLIEKPDSDPNWPTYYTPKDFYIGANIVIFKHRFQITGADLFVYKYIKENQEKFSQETITNIRNYMYQKGYLQDDIENEINVLKNENNCILKMNKKSKSDFV